LQQGRVSVKRLSETLGVSAVTIRQDLRALEGEGILERTYGGAVRKVETELPLELSFQVRHQHQWQQKDAIAAAAVSLVRDSYSVALDASTTAYALVKYLKRFSKLTVITNSLIIAQAFLDSPHIQVLLPGGRLRRDSISLVGKPDALPAVNLNIGFFGTRGVSLTAGITDIDADEVAVKQALIARCLKTIIVADGSKWGETAPYTFATLAQIERIITDSSAPQSLVSQFQAHGVQVQIIGNNR
jgi:DeoR family fructose operon transcriptional repressor